VKLALGVALAAFSLAPFQCASETPPSQAREETPGQALAELAARFAAEGDVASETATLRFLCERYPKSRFAAEAAVTLEARGVPCTAAAASSAVAPSGEAPASAASASTGAAPSASALAP
jgi:hypothetical protein